MALVAESVIIWLRNCAADGAAVAATTTAVTIVTTAAAAAATGSNYIAITRREKITFTADDDAGGDLM